MKDFNLTPAWTDILKQYKIIELAGEGSYGKVYKAMCLKTDEIVAIKHIIGFKEHDYDCVKLVREIQILRQLHETSAYKQCCFIPKFLDLVVPPDERSIYNLTNMFIVMEYEDSDLKKVMR